MPHGLTTIGRPIPHQVVKRRSYDKVYRGERSLAGNVEVVVSRGLRSYALPEVLGQHRMRPRFDWGRPGEGAAHLALALCSDTGVRLKNLTAAWDRVGFAVLTLPAKWRLDEREIRAIAAAGLRADRHDQKKKRPHGPNT